MEENNGQLALLGRLAKNPSWLDRTQKVLIAE